VSARHALARPEQAPLDVVLSVIPSLPRALLARLVERAIECLDEMEPDADLEDVGDAEDGSGAEDDFGRYYWLTYETLARAGCSLSDGDDDECLHLPPAAYDGEDQSVVILPAPAGIEPCRFRVS
jgi:hypothetical protein